MVKRTESQASHLDSVKNIQRSAYLLIFTIFGISLVIKSDEFVAMWTYDPEIGITQMLLQIVLFLTVLSLVLRWIAATAHEFNLWLEWLEFVFLRSQIYMAMFGLAVALGLMLILVYDLTAFTGFFSAYLLLNYWTQWISNEHFARALKHTERTSQNKAVLAVMEHYWLKLPQLARIATMMFASLAAFSLAVASRLACQVQQELYRNFAYAVIILDIGIGETVISVWRHRRDSRLQELTD